MSSSIAARTFVAGGELPGPPMRPLSDRTGIPALRGLPIDPTRAYFYWELPESAVGPYRLQIVDDTGAVWLDTTAEWQIAEHYVTGPTAAMWLEASIRDSRGFALRSGRVTLPAARPGRAASRWGEVGGSPDALAPVAGGPAGWNGTVAEDTSAHAATAGGTSSPKRWSTP
jgi:hypothetical protein